MFRGFVTRGYQFEELIGAGGMGEIWAAKRTALGDKVAIKILKVNGTTNPEEARANLEKEAKATSLIQHPNVCKVFDFFEENGVCYLVMELLKGLDLSRFEQTHRSLPADERFKLALFIAKSVLRALSSAHHVEAFSSHRILHRDIKPSNIYLTIHGEVKLLDLGIAKMENDFETTKSTRYSYTEAYSSPDLWENGLYRGELYSTDNDLYSLGLVFIELVTGDKHALKDPQITADFQNVVNKWLAVKKSDRYSESRDLLKDVEAQCSKLGVSDEILLKYITKASIQAETVADSPKASPRRKSSTKIMIAAASLVIVLGGAAVLYFQKPADQPSLTQISTVSSTIQANTPAIKDVEYSKGSLTFDDDPRFMVRFPHNDWFIKLGPVSDSKYDKSKFQCGLHGNDNLCLYQIPETISMVGIVEDKGNITYVTFTINGKASANIKKMATAQLEHKKFYKNPIGFYEKGKEKITVNCNTANCSILIEATKQEAQNVITKELQESDFPQDKEPTFHLSMPGTRWKLRIGPKADSTFDFSLEKCKVDAEDKTWCLHTQKYLSNGTEKESRLDIHLDPKGNITNASLSVSGLREAKLFKELSIRQLKDKNYSSLTGSSFKSKLSDAIVSCYMDSCSVSLSESLQARQWRNNPEMAPATGDKGKTNFTFTIRHAALAGVLFGLGRDTGKAIRKSKLICKDNMCGGSAGTELSKPEDFNIKVHYHNDYVTKIDYDIATRETFDALVKSVQSTKGFKKQSGTPEIQVWRSNNEEVTFIIDDFLFHGLSMTLVAK